MEVMQEKTSGMCCKLYLLLDAKTHQLYFKSSVTHHTIMQKTTPTSIHLLSSSLVFLVGLWGNDKMCWRQGTGCSWTSNVQVTCGFMSLAVFTTLPWRKRIVWKWEKRLLSSLWPLRSADQTSRLSIVTSWRLWRGKLSEIGVGSLVVKHKTSAKILPTVASRWWNIKQ